jgi:pimeloyl-ACP methyl ester carboxylesterase
MRGVSSFAWDKPGVGESTGDWRLQTNEDRAEESLAALTFLQSRSDIDRQHIGLWGISQAGWVLPIICSRSDEVDFLIAVSVPTGTGAEQELFRVEHGLPADGYSAAETAQALAFTRLRLGLLSTGAPYEAIDEAQRCVKHEPWLEPLGLLDESMADFLRTNAFVSPRPLLAHIRCPVLAIFGERDTVIDAKESARTYTEVLAQAGNTDVTIRLFPAADHVLFLSRTGGMKELSHSFAQPHTSFAPGYLDTISEWVGQRVGLS